MSFTKEIADQFLDKLRSVFQTRNELIEDLTVEDIPSTAYPSAQAVKDYIDTRLEEL